MQAEDVAAASASETPEAPGEAETGADEQTVEPAKPQAGTGRLVSLDAFRGLTIALMLLVNNMALDTETPRQFLHAGWAGDVTLADLVYPWFLFIVGVAIPWSAAAAREKRISEWRFVLKVLGRTAALILLGCLINSSLAKRPVFDLGVLQLIGLAYCLGALLSGLAWERRLLVAAALLVGHWAALRFLPVPGAGVGMFTESQNLARHVDNLYLQPYGLQGLLSILTTGAMVLLGTTVGDLLRRRDAGAARKASWLFAAGLLLVVTGWLWSFSLPFNKPVWTAPYIVYTAGLGALVLALFYLLIDGNGWRKWAFPLVVFGMNAIVAYVLPILVKLHILSEWTWTLSDGTVLSVQQALIHACIERWGRIPGGWIYTIVYLLFWWGVLYGFYRKRWFVRV